MPGCKHRCSTVSVYTIETLIARVGKVAGAKKTRTACAAVTLRAKIGALGPISKQGDRYLRRILIVGTHAVLRRAKETPHKYPWHTKLLARRPFKVVAVALANKMARTAWALSAHGGTYRGPELAAAT
jgi:transposase